MLSTNNIIAVTATTIGGLAVAYVLGLPLAAGFSLGLILLIAMMNRKGLSLREAAKTALEGAMHTKEVVYILLIVGLLIPAWTASGTISSMIGIGMEHFSYTYFLTCAFLLSGAIAFMLGTSTGALSAVGIPVIGMAGQLGVPLAMTAGALVSGAFVGDRGSPFSSAFRLTADSVGISTREHGRAIAPTTILGLIATILFFGTTDILGKWSESGTAATVAALSVSPAADNIWLFVPPVLLVGIMLLRLGSKAAFVLAILSSIAIGTWLAGISVAEWPSILWNGWSDGTGGSHMAKGVSNMIELVVLIALAGSFNGLLERSGAIEPIVRRLFASETSLAGSTWRAGAFGLGLDLVACTQTLPIMMTGRHLRAIWEPRFGAAHLGRVVADTSLLFAALVPWNMLAILCGTILGVPVSSYVPFAVYVWSIPIFTLLYSRSARRLSQSPLRFASRKQE